MSFSLLNHAIAASANTNTVSVTLDTTGADLLEAFVVYNDSAGTGTISDTLSISWSQSSVAISNRHTTCFYKAAPATTSSHTITFTTTGGFPAIGVVVYGAGGTPTFDNLASNTVVSTSLQPGSLTPSFNGELFSIGFGIDVATTPSIDSGFAVIDTLPWNGASNYGLTTAHLIQTTAASENPTWTWTPLGNGGTVETLWQLPVLATFTGGWVGPDVSWQYY